MDRGHTRIVSDSLRCRRVPCEILMNASQSRLLMKDVSGDGGSAFLRQKIRHRKTFPQLLEKLASTFESVDLKN